jgi:MFS family permease
MHSLFLTVLGCFFGMFPVAWIADGLGRRKTIQIGALIYMLGGALQTGAQNLSFMLAGRFFAGFGVCLIYTLSTYPILWNEYFTSGVGIMADLAPIYQSEIAPPSIRGKLTTLQQFMLGIGGGSLQKKPLK